MADQNISVHLSLTPDTKQITGDISTDKMREQSKATRLVYSPRRNGKPCENEAVTSRKSKSSTLARGSDSSTSSLCINDEKQKRKSLQPLQLSADGQKLLTCGRNSSNGKRTKNKKKDCESRETKIRQSKLRIPLKIHEESTQPSSSSDQETTARSCSSERTNTDVPSSSDEAYTLMVQGSAPEKYWEIVAEERRKALEETLQENMKLYQLIEELKEENRSLKEKANNTDYFATMYKVAKVSDVPGKENDAE